MAGINEAVQFPMDPSLMGGMQTGRYPNQFFDLAQQYMPPTIKELFRWCTFYFYNSPLIGSAISKISRYPITDIILDDEHESVRDLWDTIFNKELKIKERLMEINLDYHVYGNAFVSIHLPFTRFLICASCRNREPITTCDWRFNASGYTFHLTCRRCRQSGAAKVHDVPYKNRKGIRIIRWNPENIQIKYNEYTGQRIYMYAIPYKLRNAIQRGDKDICAGVPMIVIQALRERRLIRFNGDNFLHLKRPTLAEQDQGWGKPLILHVLKDMYYLYTLRRAQEAIALEHIVPFDIIYPLPNAQADPYIHSDLGSWRGQIESLIRKHRMDPNFKGVVPIPVGFARCGGDGKALLLGPELSYLNQTVVGGMGIPQEFLFGGLSYTGSSISLRTLENDFIQNRSQLLDFVLWVKSKIRAWQNLPDIDDIRFMDFRMADDVQRNQQLIGLNAAQKVSNQTLLTELGYNHEQEIKKMFEEAFIENYLNDIRAKGSARSQGEASIVNFNYQQRIQKLMERAQQEAQARMAAGGMTPDSPSNLTPPQQQIPGQGGATTQPGGDWQQMLPAPLEAQPDPTASTPLLPPAGPATQAVGAEPSGNPADVQEVNSEIDRRVKGWVTKLLQIEPYQARAAITELKAKMPDMGHAVEVEYNTQIAGLASGQTPGTEAPANPMTARKAPTRQGTAGV